MTDRLAHPVRQRVESDSLGEMRLDDTDYFGIQTQRAVDNFSISGIVLDDYPSYVAAIARIKKAAALANGDIKRLSREQSRLICRAADEIAAGKMAGQFPVDLFQGGGGTSTNMNVNEVIANRASELATGSKGYDPIHPNTHVNMGQSTNDVIPAAMKICIREELAHIEKSLGHALEEFRRKETEFQGVLKVGRTCLQDALPMTLGQMFGGYRAAVERQIEAVRKTKDLLLDLPLPGTAIGTCLGAFPGFADAIYRHLATETDVPFRQDANLFDALQNADVWMQVSASLKACASIFCKCSADFRIMGSGPRAGFNEIRLPPVQPGSSIMPGKVNPVIPEMMMQVAFRVFGNDLSVSLAADRGELDLNVWESLILTCILESVRLLSQGIVLFTDRCLGGITANADKCAADAHNSLALSTVLATLFDYPLASAIAKKAFENNKTVKETAIEAGVFTPARAEILLDPKNLTDIEVFERVVNDNG